ncbi:MAG: MerR family transcriptional regulator [Desulfobacterales bacterium]|jgi:DNA-binding transcriptional MerR regulator|nr:MerR family transcriptional regulator [Desulfobacterales bacterium]
MENSNDPEGVIPDKFYFKIGEVSSVVGLPTHVLRFWESEFKQIRPKRTASGQRLYRKKDVLLILKIKDLLYNKKFTIAGAKRCIQSDSETPNNLFSRTLLDEIRTELISIRDFLD